jgi:hypothetical protein
MPLLINLRYATFRCLKRRWRCMMSTHPAEAPGLASTSVARPTHLERTADEPRQPGKFSAVITRLSDLSPTVKFVSLCVTDPATVPTASADAEAAVRFSYEAGQWLDVHIPGVAVVGGYSLVSSPDLPAPSWNEHQWKDWEASAQPGSQPPLEHLSIAQVGAPAVLRSPVIYYCHHMQAMGTAWPSPPHLNLAVG